MLDTFHCSFNKVHFDCNLVPNYNHPARSIYVVNCRYFRRIYTFIVPCSMFYHIVCGVPINFRLRNNYESRMCRERLYRCLVHLKNSKLRYVVYFINPLFNNSFMLYD